MAWTPRARPSRLDTKARVNSTANTAASSANHPCAIFARCARRALHPWNRSAAARALSDRETRLFRRHRHGFHLLLKLRIHGIGAAQRGGQRKVVFCRELGDKWILAGKKIRHGAP